MNSARAVWMRFLFLTVLLPAAGRPALAQETTGAIQGTVLSASGAPEAQVAVTLSGPNLQGTRSTATDRKGFYQFLVVPPGPYDLRLSRIDLQPMEVKQVRVELGGTTAVPTLTVTALPTFRQTIIVQAPRITLDPAHTEAGGTLPASEYASLPVDRDYKSVIAILPQANTSYRGDPINVAGSTGLENQYYIDGVNVTDTRYANRATSLPYNFVRSVDVKTGGYEAQYGRALGAVVNAVTYSGTNDLEMSAFGFTQPGRWAMDAREGSGISAGSAVTYDWGARASGPAMKDRLWYSAAVNPRTDEIDMEVPGFGTYPDRTEAVRFATKLTWKASEATDVELSVFGDPTTRDQIYGLPNGINSVQNPDALLAQVESGGTTASLHGTFAASPTLLLQGSVSGQWDRWLDEGATELGRSEPFYNDWVEGFASGGRGWRMEDERGRLNLTARGTLLVPGHTVVAGLEYEDAKVTSSLQFHQINRLDVSYWRDLREWYSGSFHNRSPAAYLQDSWRVTDRLTLNPGLRWSGQYLSGASGSTAQSIPDEWQPRIGFSWQLGPADTHRIFGSYGRFYQTLPMNIAIMFYVDYYAIYSDYLVDPRQPGAVPDTVFNYTTYEEQYGQIDGLHADNFDEFTLGYERLLGAETKVSLRGMRRNLRSSFQWGLDPTQDPVWILGTPGERNFDFLPRPKREYTALEVALEGAWRRWQYRASYVLSRTWGNYPGLYDLDQGNANPGQTLAFFMENQATNSTGWLPNDRTHVFKLSGTYTSRFGLTGGATLVIESGVPINDFAAGPWATWISTFLEQRGSAGRTPTLWDLDLRLAYDVPVPRVSRASVVLDLLHVGNPQETVRVDDLHYSTLDENGNPDTVNPMYKRATAYQSPMAVRLGMQVDI